MTNSISEQLQNYFDELETALKLSVSQKHDIVAEIRSNAVEKINTLCQSGIAESEAVSQTLAELGSPSTLAQSISHIAPPFGSQILTYTRILLFWLLFAAAIYIGLGFRASFFGSSLTYYIGIEALFFPILLLTWPKIIWRANWLFSFIPAMIIYAICLLAISTGVSSTAEYTLPQNAQKIQDVPQPELNAWLPLLLISCLSLLSIYFLTMMQQMQQRKRAMLFAVVTALVIETPYFFEEQQIRQLAKKIRGYETQNGGLPSNQEFATLMSSSLSTLNSVSYDHTNQTRSFTISLERQFFPGHRIIYSGFTDEVVVTD